MAEIPSHPIPHSALLFMATVEEARKTSEGPFRAIAPIFRLALEPQRGQILNVELASSVLTPILGPNFTQHAFEAFVPQIESLGWLVREQANDNQAAYRVPNSLPKFDEQGAIESSMLKLDRLYSGFNEFLTATSPLLNLTIRKHEFQWQLFLWATSLDGLDKEAVHKYAESLADGVRPSIKNAFLDEPQRFSRVEKTLSVEFAGYVKWLIKHKRQEIKDIAGLTELGLAVEFVEEIRNPSARRELSTDTVFVLDAPILLDLLGLSGSSRKSSIDQCLAVLKSKGARIVTLTHCLDELSDILKSVLARPESARFGLTGDALRQNPALSERAAQILKRPDQATKFAGVEILYFDVKNILGASYFPDEMIDRFRNTATWHDQYKTDQRERDAMSIAFVMRRRHGQVSSDVLESKFVLVARNSTFTSFSELFVRRQMKTASYAFGPAIETKTLAAFIWMRFGSIESFDLPQVHLIAACDRILATNGEIMRKAERRLREMKGEDAAAVLLSSQQAVLDLVISIGGSPEVLDAANGEDLLRAFTTSAEENGRISERVKVDEERQQFMAALADTERANEEQRQNITQLALANLQSEARLRQHEEEINRRKKNDEDRAETVATRLNSQSEQSAWRIIGGVWIFSALFAVSGQLFIWQGLEWWERGFSNFLLGTFVVILSIISLVFPLRWLPLGRIDLAGALSIRLKKKIVVFRLSQIEPMSERDRVREVLRRRKILDGA